MIDFSLTTKCQPFFHIGFVLVLSSKFEAIRMLVMSGGRSCCAKVFLIKGRPLGADSCVEGVVP